MDVERFVEWRREASAAERCEAGRAVACRFRERSIAAHERTDAETILMLLLEDASPKVRKAIADELVEAEDLPLSAVRLLSRDSDFIACSFVRRTPLLTDAEILDLLTDGSLAIAAAVALRRQSSIKVTEALVEVGEVCALESLLGNPGAAFSGHAYRRLVERFGEEPVLRDLMIARDDLPAAVRHDLLKRTAQSLSAAPILINLVGETRARSVTDKACETAVASLAHGVAQAERGDFVDHLRRRGELNCAFLIRTLCLGNIDLFVEAASRLSGIGPSKLRAVVASGRRGALVNATKRCGLPSVVGNLFHTVLAVWRDIDDRRLFAGVDDVPRIAMQRLAAARSDPGGSQTFAEVIQFLTRLDSEGVRDAARHRAMALAA